MTVLIQYVPWLAAMGVLLLCAAFFSLSETALFYLSPPERRRLARGNPAERMAVELLADSDRLLTAVLFWSFVANLAYFSVASIISLNVEGAGQSTAAGAFAVGALLAMVVFGEMLPKSLGVLQPRTLSTVVAVPLTVMVRLADPMIPALRGACAVVMRVVWPKFQAEPYLRTSDLERAVRLSTSDAALLQQEEQVLQSIVRLSEIRADELMRPRTRFTSYRPPVSLADLGGQIPKGGYLVVTEPDGDEVAAAVALGSMSGVPAENLERYAEAVIYVPWCASVAGTLELMRERDRHVAAVVNELGETIGIITFEDILDTVFSKTPSRSEWLLKRAPIREVSPGVWLVTGMTSLRRLVRHFHVPRPASKSVTVAGVIQEALERLPQVGDVCRWGPFQFKVVEGPDQGQLLVELTRAGDEEVAS